jgi:alpha-1,3-rhamnosyl/mannosyltransferase
MDVDGIAGAMRRVLSDGPLRSKMIARGLERAKDFSWEKCVSELLLAFDAVAGARALS